MHQSTVTLKLSQFLIPCLFLISHSSNTFVTDNHKLVYSQCSNQASTSPSHVSLLSNLFQEFITQSSKSAFFETMAADENVAISGSFQCRNNLSPDECRSCVSRFPNNLSSNICRKARIQLNGCYARYEEENGDERETNTISEVLHGACSKRKIKKPRFVEMKYAAFAGVASGVMSENGFYEMNYELIHVVAQCAGRLGGCDCGECVNKAAEIAGEGECRYSVAGEVYLDSCFVSYDYRDGGFGTYKGGGGSTKLVAIVVGGLAILGLGIGLCYCIRSFGKKKEDDW